MSRFGLHVGRASRFHLIPRHFYSPIPDLDELPPDVFERVSALEGIEMDTGAQIEFAERSLGDGVREFAEKEADFQLDNSYYATGDAELAFAFIRHLRPRRVVELGSGFSTLAMARACVRNGAEGDPVDMRVFNPYPPESLAGAVEGVGSQQALPAQEVPFGEFEALGRNDILFVDTSHTVKLGGDVNRVVLDVLPRLAAGVHVHFHDIWLPHECHPGLIEHLGAYWNEQYLLQAFLSMNPGYEVIFGSRAVIGTHAERFAELVPAYTGANYPSSFWIRRV